MSIAEHMPPDTSIPLAALDRPIAYHRIFRKITGKTVAAVFLSQAWYWSQRLPAERDGWFYKTQVEWEEETGLSENEQNTARKTLKSLGIMQDELQGLPAQLWYRVNQEELARAIREHDIKITAYAVSSSGDSGYLDPVIPTIIHTETTTKTTEPETTIFRATKSPESPADFSPQQKPMPRNGMAQTLLAVLHEDVLHTPPPTNYKRAIADASTLAKAGCTPEEIKGIADWLLADPFWGPKGVTINRVLTRRDEWLASSRSKPVQPFNPTRYLMDLAKRQEEEEREAERNNASAQYSQRSLAGEDERPGAGSLDYRSLHMGTD